MERARRSWKPARLVVLGVVLVGFLLCVGCGGSDPATVEQHLRELLAAEHDATTWRWIAAAAAGLAFLIGVGVGSSAKRGAPPRQP